MIDVRYMFDRCSRYARSMSDSDDDGDEDGDDSVDEHGMTILMHDDGADGGGDCGDDGDETN